MRWCAESSTSVIDPARGKPEEIIEWGRGRGQGACHWQRNRILEQALPVLDGSPYLHRHLTA